MWNELLILGKKVLNLPLVQRISNFEPVVDVAADVAQFLNSLESSMPSDEKLFLASPEGARERSSTKF